MRKIAVLGAGSWGTALAIQLARNHNTVALWGHRAAHIKALLQENENMRYLPGVTFPEALTPEADLKRALTGADMALIVVPSAHFAELLQRIKPHLDDMPLIWAVKGFEHGSGRLLSDVFNEHLGAAHPHAMLAGPSFAKEVAQGKPTAVTIASPAPHDAHAFAEPFHGSNFICYTSQDIIGAQIGGAVKNVIAIATGIADGLQCGANTRAALITRGLHEMMRLAHALGADPQTLYGLAGMGDLVLTATDNQSRNRRFGLALGQGKAAADAKAEIGQVVEGEGAAHDTWALAQRFAVRMPITEQVHLILKSEITIKDAFRQLTSRVLKDETY